MKRRTVGEGTLFEEHDPRRRTTHRAEIDVRLPNGTVKRVIVRGIGPTATREALLKKAARLRDANPEADKMSMDDYLDKWLVFKAPKVRASTLSTYKRSLAHCRPHIGGIRLARLTPTDIETALAPLQTLGHPAEADKLRRTLKTAMRQAVKWGYLRSSPVEQVDPIQRPATERSVLTRSQAQLLLAACDGKVYFRLFLLALHSGLRIGELLALTWADVDMDSVRVRRTVSVGSPTGYAPPKTKAGRRRVPVSHEVIAALGRRGRHNDLVLVNRRGKPLSARNASRALGTALATVNADLLDPLPPLRLHDLRRTYATWQAAAGAHPRVIQQLLGHATPNLALEVYTDVLESQLEATRLVAVGVGAPRSTSPLHSADTVN